MKGLITYGLILFAGFVLIFGVAYVMRLANNAATPINVTEVEAGIRCAHMVTTDGVAIDCWKTDSLHTKGN